jgi:DNA-directed RNA polymerase subunit M/transcription elongation factor TFIIS
MRHVRDTEHQYNPPLILQTMPPTDSHRQIACLSIDKRSNVQILTAEDRDTWASTPKACPKCDNAELKFRDVQTRGADEGSTIFYKCPACGHGYVIARYVAVIY